jgi:hypothetical protein
MAEDQIDKADGVFWVESLFGGQTKKPLVKFTFRGQETTITSEEARAVALNILACCEAADYDAITYRVCMQKLGLGMRETQKMMTQMRAVRDEVAAEKRASGNGIK